MLICPICQAPLSAVENGVGCPANHRFDRARQGYLNLLPVQHKNSRDPGDNQAMVEARRRFRWRSLCAAGPAPRRAGRRAHAATLAGHRLWRGLLHRPTGRRAAGCRRLCTGHLPRGDQARLQTRPATRVAGGEHGPRAAGRCQLRPAGQRVQPAGLAGSAPPALARRRTAAHGADPRAPLGAARGSTTSTRLRRREAPVAHSGRHAPDPQRNPQL